MRGCSLRDKRLLLIIATSLLISLYGLHELVRGRLTGEHDQAKPAKTSASITYTSDTVEDREMAMAEERSWLKRMHVGHYCHSAGERELSAEDLLALSKWLVVDDESESIYCGIPKVGISNWKRFYARWQAGKTVASLKFDPMSNSLRYLSNYSAEEQLHRLNSYFKFMITREPAERLLSAFREKFAQFVTTKTKSYLYRRYVPSIFGIHDKDTAKAASANVTVNAFLNFIVKSDHKRMDIHWRPFHLLCRPCAVRYDFIGDHRFFAADSKYILSRLGHSGEDFVVPKVQYLPREESEKLYDQYWDKISHSLRQQIIGKYTIDYSLFGYNEKLRI